MEADLNKFTIMGDQILCYRRERGLRWQCRFTDPTGMARYIRRSLKTSDKDLATARAIELFHDLNAKARLGAAVSETTWNKIYSRFRGTFKESVWERMDGTNELYWAPFFNQEGDLFHINDETIERYVDFRLNYWLKNNSADSTRAHLGKKTARTTFVRNFTYLRSFLNKAHSKNMINVVPTFPKNWDQHPSIIDRPARERRGKFLICEHPQAENCECAIRKLAAEWRRCNNFLNGRIAPWNRILKVPRNRYALASAYIYTILIAKSGLRPAEASKLKFRNVLLKDDGTQTFTQILIGTDIAKTNVHRDVITSDFEKTYERIHGLWASEYEKFWGVAPAPSDLLFPSEIDRKKTRRNYLIVKRLFKRCGVHEYEADDGTTLYRTAYSLRSHFITMLLNRNMNIWSVALLCGTSIRQIEKRYSTNTSYSNRYAIVQNFRNHRDIYNPELKIGSDQ